MPNPPWEVFFAYGEGDPERYPRPTILRKHLSSHRMNILFCFSGIWANMADLVRENQDILVNYSEWYSGHSIFL